MTIIERAERNVSRRLVLKAGAAIGGGLMIGWRWESSTAASAEAPTLFAPNAFVRIDRQGKVSIVSPGEMAEMGQGVYTALPMLVAEELDADNEQRDCRAFRHRMTSCTATHFSVARRQRAIRLQFVAFTCPCARPARRRAPCWSRLLQRSSMWMRMR